MALPGRSLPTAWSFPLTSPAGSPGAPPDQGRLSALSWGGLHGVRCKNQQVPVGPPTRSTAASACLLTSSLWMGPGWAQGPHCVSWFSSHPSAAHGGVARLLCACCTERVLIHTPLPEHRVLVGRLLQGYGAHLGRCPTGLSSQEPGAEPSLQSTPSPPVVQV